MKQTTPSSDKPNDGLKALNDAITAAYQNIVSDVKAALPQYPTEYLRTFIEVDYSTIGLNCKHGLFSPMLHLQLEEKDGQLTISFAHNLIFKQQLGNRLDNLLTRLIFEHTNESNTSIPIEEYLNVSPYNMDNFRQAKSLLDRGFKGGCKTTIEALTIQGA
jgi:hypothetical protein